MADFQRWTVTEPYVDLSGSLLEGPHYDESKNELRFIDIMEEKLHFLDLEKGPTSLRTMNTGNPVGVTANVERTDSSGGGKEVLAVGAKLGFATLDLETGKPSYIRKVWTDAEGEAKAHRMRSNDGNVDSRGRFWVGMMSDLAVAPLKLEGALFRLDPDLSAHRMVDDMGIPNGLGWNEDETVMYVTDSPSRNIYAYDFDAEKGEISNRRVFFTAPTDGDGGDNCFPDGFAMDEEGYFWVALWGGFRMVRVSPEGKIVGEISLPAKCVSCAEFAGTDLFITTAKDSEASSDSSGGRLYKVNVGVRGKPRHKVKFLPRSLKI